MNFKEYFYSKINEDEGASDININSTLDVAMQPKPLFGSDNGMQIEVMCRNCNTKNTINKDDKAKKLKCAFCGTEN